VTGEQYEAGLRYQAPGSDFMLSAAVYQSGKSRNRGFFLAQELRHAGAIAVGGHFNAVIGINRTYVVAVNRVPNTVSFLNDGDFGGLAFN